MRKDRLVHLIGRTGRFDSFNSFELRFSHVHAFLLLCYAFACPFYSTLFFTSFFRLIYLFAQKKEQDKRTLGTRERQKNVVCIGSSVCKSKLVLRGAKRGRGGKSLRVFFFSVARWIQCVLRGAAKILAISEHRDALAIYGCDDEAREIISTVFLFTIFYISQW